jgi:hypothetical protein
LRPTRHLEWLLIVCCLLLCALFAVACSFDDDPDVSLCPADDFSSSPDVTSCAPPVRDGQRLGLTHGGRTASAAPALLAAVPGGLCLLI